MTDAVDEVVNTVEVGKPRRARGTRPDQPEDG